MEYVYAALLLHKAGKDITEDAVKKVLTAAGVSVDEAKIKALVAALEGKNIDEIIEKASFVAAAPAAAPAASTEEVKEEAKEEEVEENKEEDISAGLSSLFG